MSDIRRHDEYGPSLSYYVPSGELSVLAMLEMLELQPGEVLYDLGSGDGRILIKGAEEYDVIGVGIERLLEYVEESRKNIEEKGLSDRIEIIHGNLLDESIDLSPADAVTIYLSRTGVKRLKPKLERDLRPECRVVMQTFSMPGWPIENMQRAGWPYDIHLYRMSSIKQN